MSKGQKIFAVLLVLIAGLAACLSFHDSRGNVKGLNEKKDDKAEIIFLDVGQGDAILIQQGRTQVLIDGGDGQQILNRLGRFMPFGDNKVDFVVVTHPDEDHMGGLIKVLESYEVGEILESGIDCDKDICEKWEELIAKGEIETLNAKLGQNIRFGEDIDLSVLYPFSDLSDVEFKNSNEASLVLKAVVEDRKYLLMADTENKTEKELMASNLNLDADVLKVSHHGSKSATSADFLMEVTPEKAVISVGENSYGHPTEEVLTRLSNMNIEILRTDEEGSIAF